MIPTNGPRPGVRVSFDIGGTFTDIVAVHADGTTVVKKTLSVLDTLVSEVRTLVERALARDHASKLSSLVHTTTVASNALLESTYAPIGLVTTSGFRDDVELRRLARPPVFDFGWERLPPIVPRRRRVEVVERIASDGRVHIELDMESVHAALTELQAQGVDSIAVSLINSHVNGTHEQLVADAASRGSYGFSVSASHDLLPKAGEFERASTTCVNAALIPVVNGYLDRVDADLGEHTARISIMQSNGGLMSVAEARRYPVRMVESGPAAGALSAAALAEELHLDRVVAFDMGGTTVKACLIEDGRPSEKYEYEVGGEAHTSNRYDRGTGFAVSVPSFDIVEAGAGGGSIAWTSDGILRVGPRSAGADPGPACYGRGGVDPTVTDANVALGYMSPSSIADGSLAIDRDLAMTALARLSGALGLSPLEIADGIHQVANASMMRTIRAVTTERGHDPRDYALVAFGGSGPVHAAALAESLGVETVIVPPFPGVFSAFGLLIADLRYDLIHHIGTTVDALDVRLVTEGFDLLGRRVEEATVTQGIDGTAVRAERYIDLRYLGQSSELVTRVPDSIELTRDSIAELFHREHERTFGYRRPSEPIAVANLRLKAFASMTDISFRTLAQPFLADERPWSATSRPADFGGITQEVKVVPRRALRDGRLVAPAVIEEPDTTVVVPPGWSAEMNDFGCVLMTPV